MIKNYYQTLSLPKTATPPSISQSYLKQALIYHPKTTKQDPSYAQQKFNQISQSYEVLSDPIKRSFYDKYGYQKLAVCLYQQGGLMGGYRFGGNSLEIFQKFVKEEKGDYLVDLGVAKEGGIFGHAFGGLQNNVVTYKREDLVVEVHCTLAELYKGATKIVKFQRSTLNEDGRTTCLTPTTKLANILPGYSTSTKLSFPGQGHQTVHKTNSDLVLKIVQVQMPNCKRSGDHLVHNFDITLPEALSCTSINIPTLDARMLKVSMDQLISPQTLRQVQGEGFVNPQTHQKGNLYIKFNITFPKQLTQQVKIQLRNLLK